MSAVKHLITRDIYLSDDEVQHAREIRAAFWETIEVLHDNEPRYTSAQRERLSRMLSTAYYRLNSIPSVNRIKRYMQG